MDAGAARRGGPRAVVGGVGNIHQRSRLIGALAVLASAGFLASALPARRAASVDPLVALRAE